MGTWSWLAHWTISSTIQSGMMVGLLSLLTWAADRHLSPRWMAWLWMLIVVRLVVPGSLTGLLPFHLSLMVPTVHRIPLVPPSPRGTSAMASGAPSTAAHSALVHRARRWPWMIVGLWGAGVVARAGATLYREIWLEREIAHAHECVDLPEDTVLPVTAIRETSWVRSPAVVGLRRPILLVPPGLADRLTAREWQWVLRHEWSHVHHHDMATRWAMEIVATVYWFNPFVWLARRALCMAQELAADALVVTPLPREQRMHYGQLLLDLSAYHGGAPPSVAGMTRNPSALARRLRRLRYDPDRRRMRLITALSLWLVLTLTAVGASWSSPGVVIRNEQATRWVGSRLNTIVMANANSTMTASALEAMGSWQTTYPVSAAVVSRTLGFDVQATYRLADTKTATGRWSGWWGIAGYPIYAGYRFEIWSRPWFGAPRLLGTGRAGKPVSVAWRVGPMKPPRRTVTGLLWPPGDLFQ